jgi:hypothetical protein
MKPKNIREALDSVHALLFAAGSDLEHYLLSPQDYSPEYFESVKDAVLDAHMLVTWIKDNTKGEMK